MYALRLLGWSALTALAWITVIPVSAITGWALILAGAATPLLGAYNLLLRVTGGSGILASTLGSLNPVLTFLATFLIGVFLAVIGYGIWSLAPAIHRWLQNRRPSPPSAPEHQHGSAFHSGL